MSNDDMIEMPIKDLKWIAGTIHNAYHQAPEGKGGHWDVCEKGVCNFIKQLVSGQVMGTNIKKSVPR